MHLSDGQTKLLDLISAMENLDKFKQFLQDNVKDITSVVPKDSVLWPGYSILHLAVTFSKELVCFVENRRYIDKAIVKECLDHGLSVDIANLEGQTPIHLAFSQCKRDIYELMFEHLRQLDHFRNLVDNNNLSYLHVACTIKDEILADRLLNDLNPNDYCRRTTKLAGDLDAGSTPLHAAVISGSRATAELLLQRGADLHATDVNGMTPVHLLLRKINSHDHEVADVLFGSLLANVTNRVVDDLGLSYLHIACAFGNAELVEKLLDLGLDVNAVVKCKKQTDRGSSHNLTFNVTQRYFRAYSNFTPLQMAAKRGNFNHEVLDMLLRRGADVFATNEPSKHLSLRKIPVNDPYVLRRFFRVLWEREDMQKSMEERLGLTKLHIACYLKDEEAVRSALSDEVDVNAQIKAGSEIFPGCTPQHLLVSWDNSLDDQDLQFAISSMIETLIDRGADVTIANAEQATPLHVFNQNQRTFLRYDLCKNLLLNAHRDFDVNPVNAEGHSHFHLACYWHQAEVVEKFLRHASVDVNRPVDYFASYNGGCTPLHLALMNHLTVRSDDDWMKLSQTVDLLLKHGADVAAKDVLGDTPLHKSAVLTSPEMSIFEKLVSYGGNMKMENIRGLTPIEKLADILMFYGNQSDDLKIFQKYGYKINSWNRLTGEGYISKIFLLGEESNLSENYEFNNFLESPDVQSIDNMGRTAIRNAVAHCGKISMIHTTYNAVLENYIYAINSLIKIGIDIEHPDKSGQTALHYAARMENSIGVEALLACGADVNIVDNSGKSALSYAVEQSESEDKGDFSLEADSRVHLLAHIRKLQHLKIEVSQLNQNLAKKARKLSFDVSYLEFFGDNSYKLSQAFLSQVEMTKTLDIVTNSFTLHNFLSETGAVSLYPFLLESERDLVDHYFETINYHELKELVGVINLQTQKMRTRLGLIESALSSLRILLDFSVPGLCEQISRFLSNSNLKHLIESTATKGRKSKLSEISS